MRPGAGAHLLAAINPILWTYTQHLYIRRAGLSVWTTRDTRPCYAALFNKACRNRLTWFMRSTCTRSSLLHYVLVEKATDSRDVVYIPLRMFLKAKTKAILILGLPVVYVRKCSISWTFMATRTHFYTHVAVEFLFCATWLILKFTLKKIASVYRTLNIINAPAPCIATFFAQGVPVALFPSSGLSK